METPLATQRLVSPQMRQAHQDLTEANGFSMRNSQAGQDMILLSGIGIVPPHHSSVEDRLAEEFPRGDITFAARLLAKINGGYLALISGKLGHEKFGIEHNGRPVEGQIAVISKKPNKLALLTAMYGDQARTTLRY
jgi:hypothetical protein